jgi:hypothetical protein
MGRFVPRSWFFVENVFERFAGLSNIRVLSVVFLAGFLIRLVPELYSWFHPYWF